MKTRLTQDDIDTKNRDDKTLSELIDTVECPLDKITKKINKKPSPLAQAQNTKDFSLLHQYYQEAEKYFDGADVDNAINQRTQLFFAIACFENADVITPILKKITNLNEEFYREYCGENLIRIKPLFYAIYLDNIQAVDALLAYDHQLLWGHNDHGAMPVHYATQLGRIQILEVMEKYNEKLSRMRLSPEITPVHTAVEVGNNEVLTWLLDHDKHDDKEPTVSNIGNRNLVTPLHRAVMLKQLESIKLLLEHHANYELATGETATPPNKTPLQLAANTGDDKIVRLIMQHGADHQNTHLEIALKVLNYIDKRKTEPKHTQTFFGWSEFAGFKLVYSNDDKLDPSLKLINNIINGDSDPLSNLTSDERKALKQGRLGKIILPLISHHEKVAKQRSPSQSLRNSPSMKGGNSH